MKLFAYNDIFWCTWLKFSTYWPYEFFSKIYFQNADILFFCSSKFPFWDFPFKFINEYEHSKLCLEIFVKSTTYLNHGGELLGTIGEGSELPLRANWYTVAWEKRSGWTGLGELVLGQNDRRGTVLYMVSYIVMHWVVHCWVCAL